LNLFPLVSLTHIAATLPLLWCAGLVQLLSTPPCIASDEEGSRPRQILHVGPGRELERPSEAAKVARDGALVTIDAGIYEGDVAIWRQSRLTLRGVGGRAQIRAAGRAAEEKAIWVIKGDLVEIENVELSGAQVRSHNGAGIRAEGKGLTIRNCRLHDNEMGILTNNNGDGLVIIEDSQIDHNRTDTETHGRLGHNIYIGRIGRFILRNSDVHDARNSIYNNRLLDGDGDSSYLIDLAEGGDAQVFGNELVQGPRSRNRTAIAFAAEAKDKTQSHTLSVFGNHFVNRGGSGTFVRNHSTATVELSNNIIEGNVTPLRGKGRILE
jgi:hypothetical protein